MSKQQGFAAESFVTRALEKDGFTILERNYTSRQGEIDLIALKNDILVFVEVKQRTKSYFDLSELITPSKQKKIILTAKEFLTSRDYTNTVHRFDVALIEGALSAPKLTYIPNAFVEEHRV